MGGMTDGKARYDPRYDPRFQRGYVGSEADAPPHAIPRAEADLAFAPPPPAPPGPTQAGDAVVVLRDAGARRPVVDDRTGAIPASSSPTDADGTAASPAHGDADRVDPAAAAPSDEDAESWSVNRWLWIALGSCLAFVIVGTVAMWVSVSDPDVYRGGPSVGFDETMRLMINYVAPALVQAGIVGAVVVLVTWAIRGRPIGAARLEDGR